MLLIYQSTEDIFLEFLLSVFLIHRKERLNPVELTFDLSHFHRALKML
jgi:hypothetical protein